MQPEGLLQAQHLKRAAGRKEGRQAGRQAVSMRRRELKHVGKGCCSPSTALQRMLKQGSERQAGKDTIL